VNKSKKKFICYDWLESWIERFLKAEVLRKLNDPVEF
jgi:hypothetical protein